LQVITADAQELTAINQLIQELIAGTVRRSTFSQWELELLLDLQTCRVRRSSRPDMLRRYLRAVQLQYVKYPAATPLRLATFLGWEARRRNTPGPEEQESVAANSVPQLAAK
jgi:hypothetical protein